MARKGGLGRGLDALIPVGATPPITDGSTFIAVERIIPNPLQPRSDFDREGLEELAASIREHGVLQPLIVTHDTLSGQYILIAGERRLMASKIAGLEKVPVVVREVSEQQRLELALIENIQRSDLSPLDTARAYQLLVDQFNLTHEDIAVRVGKSRVAVTNTLRLLKLPEKILQYLADEKISEGHARVLLSLPTPQAQQAVVEMIIHQSLSVRQTEELVQKYAGQKPAAQPAKAVDPEICALEQQLRDRLGTKVKINHGKKGGTLLIHYYSPEELDSLISRFLE